MSLVHLRAVKTRRPVQVAAFCEPRGCEGVLCRNRPDLARLTALMTGALTLVSCGTLVGLTLALRRRLAMAFSNDPQVIAVAAGAMPILAASLLGDGVNCACSGSPVSQVLAVCLETVLGLPVLLRGLGGDISTHAPVGLAKGKVDGSAGSACYNRY